MFELGTELQSGHTLKWISSYRNWKHQSFNDADNIDSNIVTVADERTLELFTQELQWLSPSDQDLGYVIGAYYYDQRFPSTEFIGGGEDIVGSNGVTHVESTVNICDAALFAHADYRVTKALTLFGGYRWIHESLIG